MSFLPTVSLKSESRLANRDAPANNYAMIHISEIPNFDQLSDLDRLALAEEILATIRDPDSLPSPLGHRVELDRDRKSVV